MFSILIVGGILQWRTKQQIELYKVREAKKEAKAERASTEKIEREKMRSREKVARIGAAAKGAGKLPTNVKTALDVFKTLKKKVGDNAASILARAVTQKFIGEGEAATVAADENLTQEDKDLLAAAVKILKKDNKGSGRVRITYELQ